jgi:ArsR family transcriptional regulator
MDHKYMENSKILKALSDVNRLMIIDMLSSGEKCACKILECLHITQPTLSHHMKILCSSGLVDSRREGKWMHYSLNNDTVKIC